MSKIGRPKSRGWKNFGRLWTRGVGGLKNWTDSMDVICVSSLGLIQNEFKMYFCIKFESYDRVSIKSPIKNLNTTAK